MACHYKTYTGDCRITGGMFVNTNLGVGQADVGHTNNRHIVHTQVRIQDLFKRGGGGAGPFQRKADP